MEEKQKIKIPNHVGVIIGGNEDWAKERNLNKLDGYKQGCEKLKSSPNWFFKHGIKTVSVFLFSSKDWERPREEVNSIMKIIKIFLQENSEYFKEKGYKISIYGRKEELPGDLSEICDKVVNETSQNNGGKLNLFINYHGRNEIVDAIKKMVKNNIEIDQVHEGMVKKYLYDNQSTEPEVIVRTGGNRHLSGFLLWQAVESKIIFLNKDWPDFEESDIKLIVDEYNK